MKKIIKISIIIIVIGLLALLAYWFFSHKKTVSQTPNTNSEKFPRPNDSATSTKGNSKYPDEENKSIEGGGQNIGIGYQNFKDNDRAGVVFEDSRNELVKVADKKIVSAYTWGEDSKKTTRVRFVESGTGNIYEYNADTKTTERISNKIIPKIKEVLWGNENNLIIRYMEGDQNTLKTYVSTIKSVTRFDQVQGTTTETTLDGSFLPDNIRQIAVSPSGQKIFYMLDYNGFTQSFTNKKPEQIFSSELRSWLVSWPIEDKILIQTPPSYGLIGYAYTINPKISSTDADLTKVVGPISGLIAKLGKNSKLGIFSGSNYTGTSDFSIENNGTMSRLGISTLVDKCSFARKIKDTVFCATPTYMPEVNLPDDWYKGFTTFDDLVYSVNLTTGMINLVFDIQVGLQRGLDIVDISTNDDDSTLIFKDKKSDSLWMLSIKPKESFI